LLKLLAFFTNIIQVYYDNIYVTINNNNMNDLLQYIDFTSICEDNNLTNGDITPKQTIELENIIKEFIKQNK